MNMTFIILRCYVRLLAVSHLLTFIIALKVLSPRISVQQIENQLTLWKKASNNNQAETVTMQLKVENLKEDEYIQAATFLTSIYGSKNRASKACKDGLVSVNKKKIFGTRKLSKDTILEVIFPVNNDSSETIETSPSSSSSSLSSVDTYNQTQSSILRLQSFTESLLNPIQNPPVHILYEDNDIAVVFKPSGVHSLSWAGTMKKNALAFNDCLSLLLDPPYISTSNTYLADTTPLPINSNIDPNVHVNKENRQHNKDDDDYNDVSSITSSTASSSSSLSSQQMIQNTLTLSRPLPCHRLDARVSGCLVVAKTKIALASLSKQFESREVRKEYRAVLAGYPKEYMYNLTSDGCIEINQEVQSLPSTTLMRILYTVPCPIYGNMTLVQLYPQTGRRHQLRQHCASIGCPIIGDDLYHDAAYYDSIEDRITHMKLIETNGYKSLIPSSSSSSSSSTKIKESDTNNNSDGSSSDGSGVVFSNNFSTDDDDDDNNNNIIGDRRNNDINKSSLIQTSYNNLITRKRVSYPSVRKGIGLYLSSVSIGFHHPVRMDNWIQVQAFSDPSMFPTPSYSSDRTNTTTTTTTNPTTITTIDETSNSSLISISQSIKDIVVKNQVQNELINIVKNEDDILNEENIQLHIQEEHIKGTPPRFLKIMKKALVGYLWNYPHEIIYNY